MAAINQEYRSFKRAVRLSITAHVMLIILIVISPYLPKTSKKGMVHYVNVISFPGGGGSGGGGSPGGGAKAEKKLSDTQVPQRESLRDLTTPQKLQQEKPSALRHPTEKPKKEKARPAKKKDAIQKTPRTSAKDSKGAGAESSGSGSGTGVPIGIGEGTGSGVGFGSEFSGQIGLSSFPYTYYLQVIHTRISGNWFTSQISPGVTGEFHTTVSFKIFRTGEISSPEIKEQSGIRPLDLSALRAIHSSAPFPPLPHDYEEDYLGITLIFWHKK
jgi:outer membrane biosynthesis protein TonB